MEALMPLPGTASKESGSLKGRFLARASWTMASARGCSDTLSAPATNAKISFGGGPVSCTSSKSVNCGFP